jgi:metal-sulfur cluster biosynthetic enzyme
MGWEGLVLPEKEDIIRILNNIKDIETEMSVLDLGLIKSIDYIESEQKLLINVDFRKRTPSCRFCMPIAWLEQRKIMDELVEEFLLYEGITKVEFVDR